MYATVIDVDSVNAFKMTFGCSDRDVRFYFTADLTLTGDRSVTKTSRNHNKMLRI